MNKSEEFKKIFKILALDGGGIKGLYSAVILKKIQDIISIDIKDYFDLIIGTSTGSILASAVVCDISLDEVINMYETKGNFIFSKNFIKCLDLFRSKYNSRNLSKTLNIIFKEITLGDIDKPLMIIASNILNNSVYIHKSNYLKDEYTRDGNTRISEAILSSCAAPTYFDPVKLHNNYLLADGGLWANNPSILGLIEAMTEKRFNQKIENIKILSIGTGTSNIGYNKNSKWWGFCTGWKREKLIEYILELASQSSSNTCELILKDNYLRVNSHVEHKMDDMRNLNNLKELAHKCFSEHQDKIKQFLDYY